MSSLVFDNHSHMITLYSAGGAELGSWEAHNNAQRSSNGPFPLGTHSFSHHMSHPGDGPNGMYGSHGNFVFDVPGRSGMGVHSGRSTSRDRAGRAGTAYATNGCIRTTDTATSTILSTHHSDPLRTLTVR